MKSYLPARPGTFFYLRHLPDCVLYYYKVVEKLFKYLKENNSNLDDNDELKLDKIRESKNDLLMNNLVKQSQNFMESEIFRLDEQKYNLNNYNNNISESKLRKLYDELFAECKYRDKLLIKMEKDKEKFITENGILKVANETLISNLKLRMKKLEHEIADKDAKISELKKNLKCSRYTELLKENEVLNSEMEKLKNKIKNAFALINEYKKQISELNLEIEKLKLEIKLQKENNIKFKDFFSEKINISDQNFEQALNDIRIKLHKKVEDKINEYNELKAEFLNAKIERDKYYGEYNILYQDYQETKKIFQQQYLDIQKEKQEKEIEMSREIGYSNDKLNALLSENKNIKIKISKLENKNKELEQEKNIRDKLEIKNKEINEEVGKIKQEKEDLEKENEELKIKNNELIEEK